MSASSRLNPRRLTGALEFPYRTAPTPVGVKSVRQPVQLGAYYDTDWARTPVGRAARRVVVEGIMRPTVTALARPRVRSLDRLADMEGPAIFAANHHSHIDTPLLICSIPTPWRHRLVVGAAADYFFASHLTGALSALTIGAIPVERQGVGRRSARLAASLIEDGWSVLIFPEGGRSPDGWGQPFMGGTGYLAIRCGVPVVPVHVEGTGRILPKGRNLPRTSATTVTFGAPLIPTESDNSRRFATRIETAVATLADECATDWYQARRRAYAGTTPGLTGPAVSSWRRAWALGDRSPRSRRQRRRWP